jgi:ribonuclease-3
MRKYRKGRRGDSREEAIEKKLGHRFRDRALLRAALTHPSVGAEGRAFEPLEFLGDAILNFLTGLFVYRRHPDLPPGGLTRLRASLVNRTTLARAATQLGLPAFLRLGDGARPQDRERSSLSAETFEAIVAALYLDGGLGTVNKFLKKNLLPFYSPEDSLDPKSELQIHVQALLKVTPRYRLLRRRGPPHAPRFEVAVEAGGRRLARGKGGSRRDAEVTAALAALAIVRNDPNILRPSGKGPHDFG